MIYVNGTMQLICIDGKDKKDALFVNVSNNELIKGFNVAWDGKYVSWGHGDYMGPIKDYLKKGTK